MNANDTRPERGPTYRRPNVLFVMSDQQRADTLAVNSPCQTPNLEALAAEGLSFSRCYAANPICSPSRASLFTGLLPHTHGMVDCTHTVEDYRAELNDQLPFWSQSFQAAGYRTGYYGKWHVERSDQLERFGFDQYVVTGRFERQAGGYRRLDHPEYVAHRQALGLEPKPAPPADARFVQQSGYRDMLLYGVSDEPVEGTQEHFVASRGIGFLDQCASEPERPWLLFLSNEAPHEPYVPPREYYQRYDPSLLPQPASFTDDLQDRPGIYRRLQSVWRDLSWDEFAQATACYYAYCSLVDDQLGRVLTKVKELGMWDDTIVVFTSDHGDLMGAHRLLLKGVPVFEEVYRVPLVISGPGLLRGESSERIVSLLDVAPTLTELALDEPFDAHGRSLVPLLVPPRGDNGIDPAWQDEAYAEMHGQRLSYTQRIVWSGRYKYVFNGFDVDELYDLEADPHELDNLATDPAHAAVLAGMASKMWATVRETGDFTLGQAQDGMYRFVAVGPEAG